MTPMPPRLVGLTGPNAAGKGEAARVLIEKGYAYHSLSDVVRDEATARGLDHTRENLIRTGNELRRAEGPGALAERILAKLRSGASPETEEMPLAVVDSIRSPFEVAALRKVTGFVLLGVNAPIALRFERSMRRQRAGDGTTLEEFSRKEALENTNDPAAQQLAATLALADLVVMNDGTLDDLHARVFRALRLG